MMVPVWYAFPCCSPFSPLSEFFMLSSLFDERHLEESEGSNPGMVSQHGDRWWVFRVQGRIALYYIFTVYPSRYNAYILSRPEYE